MEGQAEARAPEVFVLFPTVGNDFYAELAVRLSSATRHAGYAVQVLGSDQARMLTPADLAGRTVLVVNPYECTLTDQEALVHLRACSVRLAVVADCADTRWYSRQAHVRPGFDMLVDVGLVDQSDTHDDTGSPYWLLVNGLLPAERRALDDVATGPRPLTWTVVGHHTADRARLVNELLHQCGPRGLCFLPTLRPIRAGESVMSTGDVRAALRRSELYVWRSHHDFSYYESFRLIDAVLSGAAPCKIDPAGAALAAAVPGVYPDVAGLVAAARERAPWELWQLARDHLRSRLGLVQGVGALLAHVGALGRAR